MSRPPETSRPPPLSERARSILAVYRDGNDIPADVEARIWDALEDEETSSRPTRRRVPPAVIWAGVAVAAGVALALGLRGVDGSRVAGGDASSSLDAAVDHVKAEPLRQAAPGKARAPAVSAFEPGRDVPAPGPRPESSSDATSSTLSPASKDVDGRPGRTGRPGRSRTRSKARAPSRSALPPVDSNASEEPESRIAAEHALLADAWEALARGNLTAARNKAAMHAQTFPDGLLQPERLAIEAIADCKLQRGSSELARAFLRTHPRSPLAARVEMVCKEKK